MAAKKHAVLFGSLVLAVALAGCKTQANGGLGAVKEAPTGDNEVHWFNLKPMKYNEFPYQKSLSTVPWSADYWATLQGGISHRWQHKYFDDPRDPRAANYKNYLYAIPKEAQLKAMSEDEIARLSPAEKYDIWLGRYDLTAANSITNQQRQFMLRAAEAQRKLNGKDEIPGWQGICNGWALAAAYEKSPQKAITVKNPDGKRVKFYASDIQALISQVYFDYQENVTVRRLGRLCAEEEPKKDSNGRIIESECRDVNPMSLHMALAQYINADKPFVFDVDAKNEVWNQPVYGYRVKYSNLRARPASYKLAPPEATKLVDVELVLKYVVEAEPSTDNLKKVDFKNFVDSKTYSYTLELDNSEIVVGGEWKNGSEVPDFLWYPLEKPSDKLLPQNYQMSYTKVMELLQMSAGR